MLATATNSPVVTAEKMKTFFESIVGFNFIRDLGWKEVSKFLTMTFVRRCQQCNHCLSYLLSGRCAFHFRVKETRQEATFCSYTRIQNTSLWHVGLARVMIAIVVESFSSIFFQW
jgi:hypothetical protein